MAKRYLPAIAVDEEGLGLAQRDASGRRVPHVADCRPARQLRELPFAEYLADVPHPARRVKPRAVRRDHPGRLLPAMLQRVEPKVSESRGIIVVEDTKYAALFL
jgi:hypothetical protein